MSAVARISDIWAGICCCHSGCKGMAGVIVTGSGNVITNGSRTARTADVVIGFCGHPGVIVTGSPKSIVNGRKMARVGDVVAGCTIGVIVTGSPNSSSDGIIE